MAENEKDLKKRLSTCSICHVNAAKYRCPACLTVTCSCKCVKEHKLMTNCLGHRSAVAEPIGDETIEDIIMGDYRFLESVLNRLRKSVHNTSMHHTGPGAYKSFDKSGGIDNPLPLGELLSKARNPKEEFEMCRNIRIPNYPCKQGNYLRADLSRPLKKLRYEARQRNVNLQFLARDMSRHVVNTSHYHAKTKSIRWRVRLVFLQADVYFEHTVHEDVPLGQLLALVLDTPTEVLQGISCRSSDNYFCTDTKQDENVNCLNALDNTLNSPNTSQKLNTKAENIQVSKCDEDVACLPFQEMDFVESEDTSPSLNDFCKVSNPYTTVVAKSFVKVLSSDVDLPRYLPQGVRWQMELYKSAGLDGLSVLLKQEGAAGGSTFVTVDTQDTVKECLDGSSVVEYPVLWVLRKDHAYELLRSNNDVVGSNNKVSLNRMNTVFFGSHGENSLKYFDAECAFDDEDDS